MSRSRTAQEHRILPRVELMPMSQAIVLVNDVQP
jgi:hypothetical protein